MSQALRVTSTLHTETCCSCGIEFAMPEDFRARKLENHSNFYCPAGHPQFFSGKSEADKLRDQLAVKQREVEAEQRRTEMVKTELRGAKIAAGKAKAETSRIKQRVGGGVCPCCKRNFYALRRHMSNKHPDYRGEP